MLQSSKLLIATFLILLSTVLYSWFNHPTLEDRVEAACKKKAFKYIAVTDMYERELKVCKQIKLSRMRKHLK